MQSSPGQTKSQAQGSYGPKRSAKLGANFFQCCFVKIITAANKRESKKKEKCYIWGGAILILGPYGRVHIRNSSCGRVHIASNQNGGCILNGLTIRRVQFVLEINIEGCQSGV